MSELRDARLRRALESAPDADLLPDERTRRAVLDAARQAAAPSPRISWWKQLWQGMGDRAMPWSAAFATVVIATLVTVLWRDREIPSGRPDVAPTSESAPEAAPPALPASTPAALQPAVPARKVAPAAKPQPQVAPARKAESPRERRAEVAADTMRDQAVGELSKSGPSPQAPEPTKQADVAAAARAAAPAAPAMSRAAPPGLASQAESTVAPSWTHLRLAAQGRRIELARDQAPRLAQLLNGISREARSQEPLEAAVAMRVELMREGESAGVIELAGPQVRWTPSGGSSFTARPDEARLQTLREEIGRALQR